MRRRRPCAFHAKFVQICPACSRTARWPLLLALCLFCCVPMEINRNTSTSDASTRHECAANSPSRPDWRQCSNSTPIFIGMHRNTPLSPMKRVPGHTTSHWLRRQAAMRLCSGRAFALNTAPSLTAAEPSPDTAQRAMRFVVRCVEMCPGGHITQ